jgi:hypothetical protein
MVVIVSFRPFPLSLLDDLGHGLHFIPGTIFEGSVVLSDRFFAVCEYHAHEGRCARIFL